ncbi:MAG: hypothetical protein LBE05_05670 [Microbacterium sp.]|nr:hypothetical protein [Microbacterium sp.]
MTAPEPPTNTEAVRTHRAKVTVWWSAFGVCVLVVVICVGILIAGMILRDDGDPLIDDPGAVLVGFMAMVGAVLAFVAPKLETIRHQVQNSHKTNLRDDLDDKFDRVLTELGGVRKDIGRVDDRVGRLDDRQSRTERRLDRVFDRVDDLEDTMNPKGHP